MFSVCYRCALGLCLWVCWRNGEIISLAGKLTINARKLASSAHNRQLRVNYAGDIFLFAVWSNV